ncbi:MAG TPA: 6-bladed beta-propeller [Anaeromyxobacteraceae bacterium]|nr:6-bladed beta-propeller [Anaeromyxobacteraceae bacterium]
MLTARNAALIISTSFLVGACATPEKRPDVVWPDPPEVPRIKFVTAFRSANDLEHSNWASFKRSILGSETSLVMVQPMGLALSEDGKRLYVADYQGNSVLVTDFEKKTLSKFAPDEDLAMPFNVALDADENVYVSEPTSHVVRVFSKAGRRLRTFGEKEFIRPTGLAIDKKRALVYVADSAKVDSDLHRVLVYSLAGEKLREVGNGRGADEGQFNFPSYLGLDDVGNLYVGDTLNFRIQVFDASGKFLRAYGQPGSGPGSFARIKGMDFDGFGNLYVADGEHSVVQMFNREFEQLMWFGGYVNKLEYFDIPSCVAVDRKLNRIYVCNEHFARVNVYDLINTKADDSFVEPAAPSPAAPSPAVSPAAPEAPAGSAKPASPQLTGGK